MYEKNIATAAQAFLDKIAPPQKVAQWKKDKRIRPCVTPANVRHLRRLFKYQLAVSSGKMKNWFHV